MNLFVFTYIKYILYNLIIYFLYFYTENILLYVLHRFIFSKIEIYYCFIVTYHCVQMSISRDSDYHLQIYLRINLSILV